MVVRRTGWRVCFSPERPVDGSGVACAAMVVFLASLLATTLLNWSTARCFFICDDLTYLRIVTVPPAGWPECLSRMSNGFWRPLSLLGARLLWILFGYEPLPFHGVQFLAQALCATLTFVFACSLGCAWRVGMLGAVVFTTHLGTWPTICQYANTCDSFLAVFTLCALIAWVHWLRVGGRVPLALCTVALLLAFASKETAVVIPIAMYLWAGLFVERAAIGRRVAMVYMTAAAALVAVTVMAQMHGQTYISTGQAAFDPLACANRYADLWIAAAFPYANLMAAPRGGGGARPAWCRCSRGLRGCDCLYSLCPSVR